MYHHADISTFMYMYMSETADTNVPPPFPAGEEDEMRLFCERVKLYRMAGDSGEWKERGVGELKILRHNVTAKFRVLMRYSPQASARACSLSILASIFSLMSSQWRHDVITCRVAGANRC